MAQRTEEKKRYEARKLRAYSLVKAFAKTAGLTPDAYMDYMESEIERHVNPE